MVYKIKDIVTKSGLLRGPFGGALKKEIFVPKSEDTYKVYEQGCVLNRDHTVGNYYISKRYFDEKMKHFEVVPGDLLVSCSGVNYGAIYKMPNEMERGIINQALLRIRLRTDIVDSDYFCFLFENLISEIITSSSGDSTIPNFPPLSTIKEIEIDLPDLDEQSRIASFLMNYRNLIQKNELIIGSLTNKIKEIYSYWFEQFKYPGYNDKNLTQQYYKILIPQQWGIRDFLENDLWSNIKPGIRQFEGTKYYLSTSEVEQNSYVFDKRIDFFNRESRANMQPIDNSIWFAKMKKTVKHLAVPKESPLIEECVLSTGFLGLKCKENAFEYLWAIINSSWFEKSKDNIASGSTQEAISEENINYLKIIVPPDELLDLFHEKTKDSLSLICQLNYENIVLENDLAWFAKSFLSKQATVG